MPGTSTPDYYKILQVDPLAEEEVIEAAYRRLARKYHPDVYMGPSASERMRELNLAYGVIGNPAKRRAYDAARQRAQAHQEMLAAQAQMMATHTTGPRRAVNTGPHHALAGDAAVQHAEHAARRAREAAIQQLHSTVPSVRVSTGNWPAITPTTGKLPVTPKFVYRRPILNVALEELYNLGQGILAIGLLGYPMAIAILWFPLQALWVHLGFSQHQGVIFTLVLLLPPMLLLSWWFGRRIRSNRY